MVSSKSIFIIAPASHLIQIFHTLNCANPNANPSAIYSTALNHIDSRNKQTFQLLFSFLYLLSLSLSFSLSLSLFFSVSVYFPPSQTPPPLPSSWCYRSWCICWTYRQYQSPTAARPSCNGNLDASWPRSLDVRFQTRRLHPSELDRLEHAVTLWHCHRACNSERWTLLWCAVMRRNAPLMMFNTINNKLIITAVFFVLFYVVSKERVTHEIIMRHASLTLCLPVGLLLAVLSTQSGTNLLSLSLFFSFFPLIPLLFCSVLLGDGCGGGMGEGSQKAKGDGRPKFNETKS